MREKVESHAHVPKIFIIDDEESILDLVRMNLELEGYETAVGSSGADALRLLSMPPASLPDLLILDVMLPDASGLTILHTLRKRGLTLPIIMLTAKGAQEDRILGLKLGADDYVPKPFASEELILRVKAVLRRSTSPTNSVIEANQPRQHGVKIVSEERMAYIDGTPVRLTRKEFDTLALMVQHRNLVFTREHLLKDVWGYDFAGSTRAVDILIQRLRKKLGAYGNQLETLYGTGYRWREI